MASVNWPIQLPDVMIDSFSASPEKQFLRTDMEKGPAKQRRFQSQSPEANTIKMYMTQAQRDRFEAWFHYEVGGGANWFNIQMPTPRGLATVEVRFVSPYSFKAVSHDAWYMTAKIEQRKSNIMTLTEYQAL